MDVRHATINDLDWICEIAKRHKYEIGFVRRVSLEEAIKRGTLIVLDNRQGFCEFYSRKDGWTSVYAIVSEIEGGGRSLMDYLPKPIRLSCPVDLEANRFYEHMGGTKIGIFDGKKRQLVEWQWSI